MDVLKILKESSRDLYPEDLDFFVSELETGDYDSSYVIQCKAEIEKLRRWFAGGKDDEAPEQPAGDVGRKSSNKLKRLDPADLVPPNPGESSSAKEPQSLSLTIESIRNKDSYKTAFKELVAKTDEIDTSYVDRHSSFFTQWELDAIISVKQMGEEFLEKYFGALDHDKISRYQLFSEEFFMKHYSELNPETVLKYGKNDWRKKGNRSKQLDVFLRLKGVKI